MEKRFLKDLKQGEYFTLKPYDCPDENKVYVRGEYERTEKKYSCTKFTDTCAETFKKGATTVYTGFTF